MNRVIIEIKGGTIQNIISDDIDLKFIVLNHDTDEFEEGINSISMNDIYEEVSIDIWEAEKQTDEVSDIFYQVEKILKEEN